MLRGVGLPSGRRFLWYFLVPVMRKLPVARELTFTHDQLEFWPCRVRQNVVRLNHGRNLTIGNGEVVGSLRGVSGGRREDAVCRNRSYQPTAAGRVGRVRKWQVRTGVGYRECGLTTWLRVYEFIPDPKRSQFGNDLCIYK